MDAENDFDEYFDKNEIEEYLSVVHVRDHETFERGSAASSQQLVKESNNSSFHILPVSNTKFHAGHSQFEDDEMDSIPGEDEESPEENEST